MKQPPRISPDRLPLYKAYKFSFRMVTRQNQQQVGVLVINATSFDNAKEILKVALADRFPGVKGGVAIEKTEVLKDLLNDLDHEFFL